MALYHKLIFGERKNKLIFFVEWDRNPWGRPKFKVGYLSTLEIIGKNYLKLCKFQYIFQSDIFVVFKMEQNTDRVDFQIKVNDSLYYLYVTIRNLQSFFLGLTIYITFKHNFFLIHDNEDFAINLRNCKIIKKNI